MNQKKTKIFSDIQVINDRIELLNKTLTDHPHSKQRQIITAVFKHGHKRVLLICGRNFGKSTVVMYIALRKACFPNQSIYIVGPDRTQQKKIMWKDPSRNIQHLIPPQFGATVLETESTIRFPWGSFITIDGSENFDSYRGIPYDLMIIDEARNINWKFYDASYPNLAKKDGSMILISSRPDFADNPFELLSEASKKDPDWYVLEASSWENPKMVDWLAKEKKKYFDRGEVAEWMLEYENKRVAGGKRSIFPMFQEETHVRPHDVIMARIERDKHHLEYYTIFDPGTNSVFAVLFLAYNRMTSQVFLLDEIYEKDRTKTSARKIWARADEKEKELYSKFAKVYRIYDEAAAWFARELSDIGVPLIPTDKESRSKEDDLSIIKDFMLAPEHFQVSERCPCWIREALNYQTDDNNKIIEHSDHLMDDTRYGFRQGGFSLENLDPLPDEDFKPRTINHRLEDLNPSYSNEVELEDDLWSMEDFLQ